MGKNKQQILIRSHLAAGWVCQCKSRAAVLAATRALPSQGSGATLEWTHDVFSNPTTIEVSFLRRHRFTVNVAALGLMGIESQVVFDRFKPLCWS